MVDLITGAAKHKLITPSAYGFDETYETLCKTHNK